jgi:hypothetical protein
VTLAEYAGLACATVIFVWSPLFARGRALWPELLPCAMCVGFWVGLVGSVAIEGTRGRPFLDACLVSVSAWLLYLLGRCLDDWPPK